MGILLVLLKDHDGLLDLGLEGIRGLEQQNELGVVHLEQHAGDLGSKLRLLLENQRVETLANHLLLLSLGSSSETSGGERLEIGLARLASRSRTTRVLGLTRRHASVRVRRSAASGGRTAASVGVHATHRAARAVRVDRAGDRAAAGLLRTRASRALLTRHLRGRAAGASAAGHAGAGHAAGHLVLRDRLVAAAHAAGAAGLPRTATHHLVAVHVEARALAARHACVVEHGAARVAHAALHHIGVAHAHHARAGDALLVLGLELGTADLLALGKGDKDGLGAEHLAVHLGDGLGGLLRGCVADKAEALGLALVVAHDLCRGDATVSREFGAELVVVDGLVDVLDEEVDALVLLDALKASLLELGTELSLALGLLLGAGDPELLVADLGAMEGLAGLLGVLRVLKVDKAEAAVGAVVALHDHVGGDLAVLCEHGLELGIVDRGVEVLDKDVGELALDVRAKALVALLEEADKDLLVVDEHAVHLFNGGAGGLLGLKVDETVALGLALLVHGDLAASDGAELAEGVVESLVVDLLVEVLDEHVSNTALASRRVALAPHDAALAALDRGVVEALECAFCIVGIHKVHIGIPK
eukprot:comp20919_c0_seq1/m.43597 comp20919_c0_seq1/g.43597  ORF comp20919_c0_seq1/g.43597 comp20919_c0_seq1/m.43597 type:complete len:589 (+) comp20919_c0_seq1:259-2025(+)